MMVLSKSFLVLLTISVTLSLEPSSEESPSSTDAGREVRNFGQQDWRALDQFQSTGDNSGWIPQPQQDETEVTTKRRKIRKRKRRPPVMISLTEQGDFVHPVRKRILRPQRLDAVQSESWEEMTAENPQKSSHRRRITPTFEESEEHQFERIRDPFTALQEEEEKQRKKQEELNPTKDLKNLLKSSGGTLSLSEILQQRNLSLSELLMGKKEALSAILEEKIETTTLNFDQDTTKYKRLPPSIALGKSQNNRNGESEIDELTSEEILEAQRKRLSLLHGHKDSKLFQEVVKVDVITEATTEKRIFVTATEINKPEILMNEEVGKIAFTTEEIETSTLNTPKPTIATKLEFTTNKVSYKPLLLKSTPSLPLTSAKLSKLTSTKTDLSEHNSVLPPKAVKIDVEEVLGLRKGPEDETENDLPLKMTIDLESFMATQKSSDLEVEELSPEEEDKLKVVTAKDEIMEILKNPTDRENLSRILRIRNMTVEELVQQRERGSSQLHLADIFHNDTREPEPKDEPFVGQVNADYFNNFPVFNRQQKSRTFPHTGSNSVVKKELSKDAAADLVTIKPKEEITITSFPTYKIETTKNVPPQPFLPIWNELYPSIFASDQNRDPKTSTAKPSTTDEFDYEDLQRLEELDNHLEHEVTNDRLNVDLLQNDEEFINLPTGVKSAILASFAIVGLSIMVFLTILVIFKWSQKQRRRLSYSSSFSGSKIKSPILEAPNRRTLKSFMTETLGRKKNYYKNHLQSMSDSIWDSEKKPCYM